MAKFPKILRKHNKPANTRNVGQCAEIAQTNDHYAVQGHSRSPILVPIESSSRTSYK